jgi:zinc protease
MSKKITLFLSLTFILFPSGTFGAPPIVKELESASSPDINVPHIEKKTLQNGFRVLMLPQNGIPMVRGYFFIRTGSVYEDPNHLGLANLTGQLLRTGGTKKLTSAQFNEALASIGAEVQAGINNEYGFVSFKCLSEDLPRVLDLIFQMLHAPAFEEKKLELIKSQMLESLRRQNDQPSEIGMREFPKLIYGKNSIWSRTPTMVSVRSLTRTDVEKFYKRFYYPNNMILAIAGDFSPKSLEKELNLHLKDWEKSPLPVPKLPPVKKTMEAGTFLAAKNIDQTTILVGHFGEKRFNPDKYALLLLNDILGGDVMSSRLGRRIRSTLGLSYGIYSRFGLSTDYGVFYVFAQTKGPATKQVISEIKKILTEISTGKTLTKEELEEHKKSVVNSLYAEYEPKFNFVKDEARFEYFGYPPNYLEYFRKKIQGVKLSQVRRAARKYLHPEALKVLIVGDEAKIGTLQGAKRISLEIL